MFTKIKAIKTALQTATLTSAAFLITHAQIVLAADEQNNFKTGAAPKAAANFNDVATNVNGALTSFKSLAIAFAGVVGVVMVANSLYNLYKASKDPSHQVKPMAGIVGLVIGGALVTIAGVISISSSSVTGTAPTNY